MTHNTREVEEWEREFVEEGAALEHERWAKWQAYLHSKCVEHSDGKGEWVCFPAELFKRWERQIATRYADLSEDEKESDRKEARTYLPLVHHQLQKAREEERERILALAEDVEVFAAFGYDPITIKMIDVRDIHSELDQDKV